MQSYLNLPQLVKAIESPKGNFRWFQVCKTAAHLLSAHEWRSVLEELQHQMQSLQFLRQKAFCLLQLGGPSTPGGKLQAWQHLMYFLLHRLKYQQIETVKACQKLSAGSENTPSDCRSAKSLQEPLNAKTFVCRLPIISACLPSCCFSNLWEV